MVGPIGGGMPPQQPNRPESSANSWSAQINEIESNLVKGNPTKAWEEIDNLINALEQYHPQSENLIEAEGYLQKSQDLISKGDTHAALAYLFDAQGLLP